VSWNKLNGITPGTWSRQILEALKVFFSSSHFLKGPILPFNKLLQKTVQTICLAEFDNSLGKSMDIRNQNECTFLFIKEFYSTLER
jgi:hypothetical protein